MENTEKLMQYYKRNFEDFQRDLESLESITNSRDVHLYKMDEFNAVYRGKSPNEILMDVYYGSDDNGGAFKPYRKYFTFDGAGWPVSTDNSQYNADCLNNHTVGDIIDYAADLHLSDGARAIIAGQE